MMISRLEVAAAIGATACLLTLTGCLSAAPTSDPTPPRLYLLKWERTPQGTQGPQTTVASGGSFTVSEGWLGYSKADIRVYGDDDLGVHLLQVSGTGVGKCSTPVDPQGVTYQAPGVLTAHFPTQTKTAPSGTVANSYAVELDGLIVNASCGVHTYNGMPGPREFTPDPGMTWTITAKTENCCGGQVSGTFTIVVQ